MVSITISQGDGSRVQGYSFCAPACGWLTQSGRLCTMTGCARPARADLVSHLRLHRLGSPRPLPYLALTLPVLRENQAPGLAFRGSPLQRQNSSLTGFEAFLVDPVPLSPCLRCNPDVALGLCSLPVAVSWLRFMLQVQSPGL